MKRLIAVAALALVAFYAAWPAWTAFQIAGAIKGKDAATLDRKIDFTSVRESLKPTVEAKIGEIYDKVQQSNPGAGAIIAGIRNDVVPKLAGTALTNLITAQNLIRVVTDGGTMKENAERILRDEIDKIGLPGIGATGALGRAAGGESGGIKLPGGLGQLAGKMGIDTSKIPGLGGSAKTAEATPAQSTAPSSAAGGAVPAQSYGLANIKSFSFVGPLGFAIGFAKDQAAKEADVVTEMRFSGGDWRVTAVRPRL